MQNEFSIEALGQTWRFSISLDGVFDPFAIWARSYLPSPIDEAEKRIEKLSNQEYEELKKTPPDQVRIACLREQMEHWTAQAMDKATTYLAWGSAEMSGLLKSPRGAAQLMYLCLRKHHPEVTPQMALNLLVAMSRDDANRLRDAMKASLPA